MHPSSFSPVEEILPLLHIRTRGRKETLFLDKTVAECYDEVLKGVDTLDFDDSLQTFSEFPMGDGLVRLAYFQDKLHWDVILRYDTLALHHQTLRDAFEIELLKEGLLIEKEASLDGKSDAFVKILCPFDKLMTEAQARRLHLPVKVSAHLKKYQVLVSVHVCTLDVPIFRTQSGHLR